MRQSSPHSDPRDAKLGWVGLCKVTGPRSLVRKGPHRVRQRPVGIARAAATPQTPQVPGRGTGGRSAAGQGARSSCPQASWCPQPPLQPAPPEAHPTSGDSGRLSWPECRCPPHPRCGDSGWSPWCAVRLAGRRGRGDGCGVLTPTWPRAGRTEAPPPPRQHLPTTPAPGRPGLAWRPAPSRSSRGNGVRSGPARRTTERVRTVLPR